MNNRSVFRTFLFFLSITILSCSENTESPFQDDTNSSQKQLFTSLPSSHTSVDFVNNVNESTYRNSMYFDYFLNGGGVAIGDINNDGLADLFFTGNDVPNRLYLNTGNLTFKDISESALPKNDTWSTGVNMVDINGDGYLDIFICHSGLVRDTTDLLNELLINNGDLTFTNKIKEYGLDQAQQSIHSSFFDFDNDGDLDLWLNNHVNFDGDIKTLFENEERADQVRAKFRSRLYENRNGKFYDITEKAGVSHESASLGVVTLDFNADGLIDIYVSNDYDIPDYYYQNMGDGTFSDVSKSKLGHTSFYSMGIDASDINNDQILDIVAVDMTPQDHVRNKVLMASMDSKKFQYLYNYIGLTKSYMFNSIQMGMGEGTFSEIGNFMGASQTEWSWAPLIADFDNDGLKDLYITNGYLRDTKDNDFKQKVAAYTKENGGVWNDNVFEYFSKIINSTPVNNRVFRNNGERLVDVTGIWSKLEATFSNGAAYGDLDNDGDLDVVINNLSQEASILRNDSKGQNYLQIILSAPTGEMVTNSEITIKSENLIQRADYIFSRGYQSSVDQVIHFGLGKRKTIDELQVKWPDGKKEMFGIDKVNAKVALIKGHGKPINDGGSKTEDKYFTDISKLSFDEVPIHLEMIFDDFKKEILLPHKYSDLGPALATGDIDGDGLMDFFLGGSNISESRLFINKGTKFQEKKVAALEADKKYEDLGAHFFDYNGDGHLDLYVASGGGGEIEAFPELTQDRLYRNDGKGNFINASDVLPPITSSTKAILSFDPDNDGDLDLLVGGRNSPGNYPVDAKSYFLENNNGIFRERSKKVIQDLPGMITDFIAADMNGDGWTDLLIVSEWSSPSLYMNKLGIFEQKPISALTNNYGWWQSIEKADLDEDGDLDFILGNMGENTKFHPSMNKPLGILASDFDDSGSLDIVLTKKYNDKTVPVRGKECSSQQMPGLVDKFPTYEGFATSSIEEILGEQKIEKAYSRSVTDFSSYVLINEGDFNFSIQKLPVEAQWFPIMDIEVDDFNKDGKLDLFLVGNKINAEPETPSYDAGKGLILLGDGKFNFKIIKSIEKTGINACFDARASSVIEGSDSSKLLVIANNNGPLQVYKLR